MKRSFSSNFEPDFIRFINWPNLHSNCEGISINDEIFFLGKLNIGFSVRNDQKFIYRFLQKSTTDETSILKNYDQREGNDLIIKNYNKLIFEFGNKINWFDLLVEGSTSILLKNTMFIKREDSTSEESFYIRSMIKGYPIEIKLKKEFKIEELMNIFKDKKDHFTL